jgi:hypothetical protein
MGKHKLLLLDEKNMDKYTHNTIGAQPQPTTKISSNDPSCSILPFAFLSRKFHFQSDLVGNLSSLYISHEKQ